MPSGVLLSSPVPKLICISVKEQGSKTTAGMACTVVLHTQQNSEQLMPVRQGCSALLIKEAQTFVRQAPCCRRLPSPPLLVAKTGKPHVIASITVSPKASYRAGCTKAPFLSASTYKRGWVGRISLPASASDADDARTIENPWKEQAQQHHRVKLVVAAWSTAHH